MHFASDSEVRGTDYLYAWAPDTEVMSGVVVPMSTYRHSWPFFVMCILVPVMTTLAWRIGRSLEVAVVLQDINGAIDRCAYGENYGMNNTCAIISIMLVVFIVDGLRRSAFRDAPLPAQADRSSQLVHDPGAHSAGKDL